MLCAVITLNLGAGLCFLALTVATVNTAGEQLTDCVFCSEQLQKAHRHNSQSTQLSYLSIYFQMSYSKNTLSELNGLHLYYDAHAFSW